MNKQPCWIPICIGMTMFIMLLLAPVAMGVEIVLTASGAADDLFYDYDGADTYTAYERDSLMLGYRSSTNRWYGFGITFDNVTIPQNATITSCVLRVKTKRAFTTGAIGIGANVCFGGPYEHATAPNGGNWESSPDPYAWAYGSNIAINTEFDIDCGTTSLQNTVGLDGWASGNSVTVYVGDDLVGSDSYMILQSVQTFAHTLTVNYTYTPPASGRQRIRVQASMDDVLQVTGDDVYPTTTIRVGNDAGSQYNMGMRFLNAQIPNGCNVDSLYLTLRSSDVYTATTCIASVDGEDVDDAATFSTNANYTGRTRTTASVAWNPIAAWSTGSADYLSVNFPDVGDEIFARAGWAAGNDFVIFVNNNGSSTNARRHAYSWDTDPLYAPVITIVYSAAASGTTPKGLRRKIIQMGSLEPRYEEWTQWEGVQ